MTRKRSPSGTPSPAVSQEQQEAIFRDGEGVPGETRGRFHVEEPSQELCRALEGDREATLSIWRDVARGLMYDEHRAFLHHVANTLLEADAEPAGTRPAAIMRAVGLAGKADPHRRMREVAAALRDFGASHEQILDYLQAQGLIDPEAGDVRSLLARELAKEPRPRP